MRLVGAVFTNVTKMLDFYSQFNPSPLSIKQFFDFGLNACERKSYIFLRKELPVRLANIMKEIALLPDNLLRMPSVALVNQWYERSFHEIIQFEKQEPQPATLHEFCERLIHIRNRHADVVQTMAQGVLELKESHDALLFGEQLGSKQCSTGGGRQVGSIDPACDVLDVVRDAYENARFLCDRYYLGSPPVDIVQHVAEDKPMTIVYVPSHLYHILFELFKNAMRAVMERHENDPPPIRVLLARGKQDICLKMSDMGGGIARSESDLLFKYMYSTAPQPSRGDAHTVPLAGYGYGLPISRLYARYFHGDLTLQSVEGYGTDAVVYLKALTDEANELLPIFNKTSSKFYRHTAQLADWSGPLHNLNTPNKDRTRHGRETGRAS